MTKKRNESGEGGQRVWKKEKSGQTEGNSEIQYIKSEKG